MATRQLKPLGYNRASAARAAKVGRLHRVHRGVYAVGRTDLGWKGRCMAAVLACAPAVASHWSAAWLWGLAQYRPSNFDLIVPSRRGHRRRELFVHYAPLVEEDVAEVAGIPTTSLERTHLDLAGRWPDSLPKLLERAEKAEDEGGRRIFDLGRFESLLARTPHHPGHGPLQKALRIYRPDLAVTRSSLERDFRALLKRSSLPLPATNHVVGPYEIDAYWEAERFGVEIDVFATHGSRLSFERDRERADDLLAIGIEIIRVTDVRLEREPDAVVARLASHLERRRRTLA